MQKIKKKSKIILDKSISICYTPMALERALGKYRIEKENCNNLKKVLDKRKVLCYYVKVVR